MAKVPKTISITKEAVQMVNNERERFKREHGISLNFSDAAERLIRMGDARISQAADTLSGTSRSDGKAA